MAEQTPLLKEQPPEASAPPQGPPLPQGPPPSYQTTAAPPPGYSQQPPPQQPVTQVLIQPATQVLMVTFSDVPVTMRCPNCNNDIKSNVSFVAGTLTYLIILLLIFLGFWLGCCLIPLCIDGLKDVHHTCPVCSYHLGSYKRL